MGVGTAVGAGVVLFICIALFVAGARMDESSVRSSVTHAVDAAPLRRSLASLKYENSKLRKQIDTAVEENRALRARLRAGLPQGASLEADISKTPLPVGSAVDGALSKGSVALADAGQRPSALAERLLTSTEFNKERAQAVAKNSQIILTFVNKIRLDFATTWVKHVRNLGLTNWLVGATDRPALRELKRLGIPCFDMTTNLPEGEWPWGSPSFKALGPHKIELIYKSITWDLEVIITDVDALVLREPFAYTNKWRDAGFLTTSDHLGNTTNDGGLEDHRGIHTAFNIGYMFFRKSALPLVEEWRRVIAEDPRTRWDQGEFNRLARFQWKPQRADGLSDPRLFWAYKEQVIGGVLPLSLFCGGHNYFVSQFAQRNRWEPYSIHTTYQYAAAAGKRHRLREARVWIDPPEYYDPPGGLLSFVLDVPDALVYPPGGMTTQGHIALIQHQMRQIRSALALANALGRKLVLPAVTCGYDKYWGPLHRGVIPGTHTWALPIRECPLDHFIEVGMLDPVQTVREWSMLTNPRTPAAVLSGVSHTSVDFTSKADGAEAQRLAGVSAKVINVTSPFIGVPQADLHSPQSSVLTNEHKRVFRQKFGNVGGSWCCAPMDEMKKGAPRSAHFSLLRV